MDLRKRMEYLVKIGDEYCDIKDDCDDCPFMKNPSRDCRDHSRRVELAKWWLVEHPEEPAKVEPSKSPETYRKAATRDDDSYSIALSDGRLKICHRNGKGSESMDFSGSIEDFNRFDEEEPEEWFSVATDIITGKGVK